MGEEAPRPRSPPRYPDLCGRRRLHLEVQILNREVGFLEVRSCCVPACEFIVFGSRGSGSSSRLARPEARATESPGCSDVHAARAVLCRCHVTRGARAWRMFA